MAETTAPANRSAMWNTWTYLKDTFANWSADNASRLAAALAFWTMLSIAPLLILCLRITGLVFKDKAETQMMTYLDQAVGAKNAETLKEMIGAAGNTSAGVIATVVSLALLVWSASALFVELQNSLNTLWEVKPDPNRGFIGTIKDRAFSMALVMTIAFLLLVSLVITTILSSLSKVMIHGDVGWLMELVHSGLAIAVITALFAMMFKYLPDVKIAWRDVWIGAAVTAVLFTIGKFGLGLYLGRESATSVYGAAGSIVALLLWVYYSAMILFFGAEFTQVYAKAHNRSLVTERGAEPMTDDARAQQGLSAKRGAKPGVAYGQPKPAWQQYDPNGVGAHVVTIERPAPGTAKAVTVGVAAGAAVALVGWFARRLTQNQTNTFHERVEAVGSRLDEIENLPEAANQAAFDARLRAVDERIHQLDAGTRRPPQQTRPSSRSRGASYASETRSRTGPTVATSRRTAEEIGNRFVSSFKQSRAKAAKPRTVAERLKAWLVS